MTLRWSPASKARLKQLQNSVGTLAEKYDINPMEVSALVLKELSLEEALTLDFKDLDAIVQEGLMKPRGRSSKSYKQVAEEQHYGMPQGHMPEGIYESDYGNAVAWRGGKAYDLDMGESIPKESVNFKKFIRKLDPGEGR